ncbi:MAG TPA: peptidoglycan DD-metalloendopeptidase family protein, partial [Vicinamibacterales bacterium]
AKPSPTPEQSRLAALATEFESMLLGQMLREMRKAGSWKEESEEQDGFGGAALMDTIDMELSLRLSQAQSLGLRDQLLRQVGGRVDQATGAPAPQMAGPPALVAAVSSGFGWRADPMTGATAFHRGIDVRAAYGDVVASAGGGRVVVAEPQGGYGHTVVVDHGDGLRTRYAHLSAISVRVGDQVARGDQVGQAGRTGRATGTHVHFEATQAGRPIDPATVPGRLKVEPSHADVKAGRSDTWRKP